MSAVKAPRPVGKDTKSQHVQVFVRVRPLNETEIAHKSPSAVTVKGPKEVVVNDHTNPKISKTYAFDSVFGPNALQPEIYQRVVAQSVFDVLAGYNCTVFAYGQTGSGKTYTMEGDLSDGDQGVKAGLIPRAMAALFEELRLQKAEFVVRISFVELYNEELYDLFSPDEVPSKLRLFDDPMKKGSVVIQPLEEVPVHTKNQVLQILKKGLAKRQVAATQMNAHSSRSHTVFCATVHTKENNLEGEELVKFGKLYLVDLAGSENIGRSGSVDKRAREAGSINQSLLTLGRVINCLVERQPHVPYRESKLTRVLQDSLGGKTKTSIIATVSPAASNVEETFCTLEYAAKAKSINNRPEVNQRVSKEAVMKEYAVLIEDLKKKLNLTREGSGIYLANENYKAFVEQLEARNQDLVEKIAEIRVCVNETKRYERLFTELSYQLGSKEKRLDEVKRDLGKTTECKLKSQTKFEEESDKLAETSELVKKASHYEEHVHGQAENLISVVEECLGDHVQFHSKLENSRATEKYNSQYVLSLANEADRLRDSFSSKLNDFVLTAASLEAIGRQLRVLKDDVEEVKDLKNLVDCKNVEFLSTLQKILATIEDQANYKITWDGETLGETTERCAERVKALSALENDLTAGFESYINLMKAIGEMKGPIAETIHDVEKEWLKIVERTATVTADGLKEAVEVWEGQVRQSEGALKKIESSTNEFFVQQEKFEKEKSEAIELVFQKIANLEEMIDKHESAGKNALSKIEANIQEAGEFVITCDPVLSDGVSALKEQMQRTINDISIETCSLAHAVSQHAAELEPQITSLQTALQETEKASEDTLVDHLSAWSALATDTEDALKAREKESAHTRQMEDECFEEMRKELAELDRKYAEDAKMIQEKYGKFKGESGSSLDRISGVTEVYCSDLKEQLKTKSTLVQTFIHDHFKRDCPTGQTPPRKEMRIPPLNEHLASPDIRRIVRKVSEDAVLL